MKALVTGASGFTGRYMVDNLLEHGYKVRVFVRPTSQIDFLQEKPVEIVYGHLEIAQDLDRAVQGVDIVYHIAALYRAANVDDSEYFKINVEGTRHVLEASLRHGVKRVLHCSTGGVHGHIANPPADENAPFNSGDLYQDSKLEGEKLAMRYCHEKGLPVTIVRPTGIYGPGDMRMLKMYKMIKNRKFIMFGKGNVFYHLTFVTDTVEGFRLAAESPKAIGQAYIIGGAEYFTLAEFAKTVAKVLGVSIPKIKLPVWPLYGAAWACEKICIPLGIQPPIFRRRVDIFVKSRAFDISKAERDLGYNPQVSVEEGIKITAEWYRQNGYLN